LKNTAVLQSDLCAHNFASLIEARVLRKQKLCIIRLVLLTVEQITFDTLPLLKI